MAGVIMHKRHHYGRKKLKNVRLFKVAFAASIAIAFAPIQFAAAQDYQAPATNNIVVGSAGYSIAFPRGEESTETVDGNDVHYIDYYFPNVAGSDVALSMGLNPAICGGGSINDWASINDMKSRISGLEEQNAKNSPTTTVSDIEVFNINNFYGVSVKVSAVHPDYGRIDSNLVNFCHNGYQIQIMEAYPESASDSDRSTIDAVYNTALKTIEFH